MRAFILATLLSLASAQFSGADDASLRPGGYSHDPTGDTGVAYVHNPAWDLTPFQLYKLRQEEKSAVDVVEVQQPRQPVQQAAQPVQQASQPVQQAAPRRQQVKVVRRPAFRQAAARPAAPVRQAAPAPVAASGSSFSQNLNFQNFPANNNQRAAPVRAAPLRVAPAPVRAAPAPAPVAPQAFAGGFQQQASVPQTPTFIAQSTGHPDADFWRRAYAYAAPTYAAKAEGSSYTYEAIF